MLRAIDTLRPPLVVAENVRGLLSATADSDVEPCPWCMGDAGASPMRALGAVLADLADLGYDAAWYGLRAADVGAAHGRFRVFIFAWPSTADTGGAPVWLDTRVAPSPQAGADEGDGTQHRGGAHALTLLPTPRAEERMQRNSQDSGVALSAAVTLLPTPAVNDNRDKVLDILRERSVTDANGCRVWTGWTNDAATPYGRFSIGNQKAYAHRAAYELRHGGIPEGYEIDHLCQNTLCVHPDHLEAVTTEENRDRVMQRRTHCKRGHEFTEENTYWVRPGARACRTCRAWQDKVQKARRKGEEIPLLPTPVLNDMGEGKTVEHWDEWTAKMQAAHGNGNGHGKSLAIEAQRLLPTPVADNSRGLTSDSTDFSSLPNEVVYRWGDYAPAIARWEALTRPAPDPTETGPKGGQRLSPRFTEWLMGLPDGWVTDPAMWDGMTTSAARNAQLKACGNGVVPQQAAAATQAFLTDFARMEATA